MVTGWFYGALGLAVLQWVARWREIRWLHYATKPAVLLAMSVWFWQVGGWDGSLRWFGVALVFSLLGDVFLMLPPRFFPVGLGAFLLGHLFYILGFNTGALRSNILFWTAGLLILVLAAGMIVYFSKSLDKDIYSGRIRTGVIAYILVILFMFYWALSTFFRPAWELAAALLVASGALLFTLSDSLLAYNRFVRRIWHAHVWIMVTYHLAQFLILYGALRQFAA